MNGRPLRARMPAAGRERVEAIHEAIRIGQLPRRVLVSERLGSARAHEQSRKTGDATTRHCARAFLHHRCRRIAASVGRVKRPPAAYGLAADLPRAPGVA